MNKKIENPATCELRPVLRFLKATNSLPAEIPGRIVEVCGEGAINKGSMRK
jgi:hypothetical protein